MRISDWSSDVCASDLWIAQPNSNSFSVSVVLPASGCEMIANVRRRRVSWVCSDMRKRDRSGRVSKDGRAIMSVHQRRLTGARLVGEILGNRLGHVPRVALQVVHTERTHGGAGTLGFGMLGHGESCPKGGVYG